MKKQGGFFLSILLPVLLSGCIGNVWTGASLIYDRHHLYKKISDYQLSLLASRSLYKDKLFKQADCLVDVAIFNGDILLVGHVPTLALQLEAWERIAILPTYRRLFNQIIVGHQLSNNLRDSWITAKIRSQIFSDASIDPGAFKIVTFDQVVYLMGDVRPEQAALVTAISRQTSGVKKVVKLLQYYKLSSRSE